MEAVGLWQILNTMEVQENADIKRLAMRETSRYATSTWTKNAKLHIKICRITSKMLRKLKQADGCQLGITWMHGWRNLFQSEGHKCTSHYRKALWFQLASVTSQAYIYDVIIYTPCEGLNCTTLDKITPLWKPVGEPSEIQIGGYRVTQVNSVTGAHTIYSDWIKPFDPCVTEISNCFHSGWHYRCSVTLVT